MIDPGNQDIDVDTLMDEVRAEVARRETNGANPRSTQKPLMPPVEYRVNERRFASADQLLRIAMQFSQPRTAWPKSGRKLPIAIPGKLRSLILRGFAYCFKDQRHFNATLVAGTREILALQLENTETVRDLVRMVASLQTRIDANHDAFTAHEGRLAAIGREFDALRETNSTLVAETRSEFERKESVLIEMLAEDRANLTKLTALVDQIALEREPAASYADLAEVEARLTRAISECRAEIDRSENALVTILAANRAQIDRVETSIASQNLSERVDRLSTDFDAMLSDLYSLAAEASLRPDLESTITRIAALESDLRITKVELLNVNKTAISRNEMSGLYPAIRALREMIEYIPIHQEMLERLESARSETRIGESVEALSEQLVAHTVALAELREQITQAQQRVESEIASLATAAAHADLSTTVEMSTAALRDVSNQLTRIDSEVTELREELPQIWSHIENSAAATNASVLQEQHRLESEIAAVSAQVSAATGVSLEAHAADIAALHEQIATSISNSVKRSELDEIAISSGALKEVSDRLITHGAVLADLRQALPQIAERVNAISATVDEQNLLEKLLKLEAYVAAMRGELDETREFARESESLSGTIADVKSTLESLGSELSAAITSIDRRFHHIEFRSATYDQRLAFIEPRLSSHDDRLSQGRMIDEALGKGIEKLSSIEPRLDAHEAEIAKIAELAERTATSQATEKGSPHAFVPAQVEDEILVKFADVFRGPEALITERLRTYLPRLDQMELTSASKIVDLGSGRGEWLRLLTERNLSPVGVDTSQILVDRCAQLGLSVEREDALTYLRSIRDRSVSLFTAFHLVEHLPFAYLEKLIAEISRALAPNGMVILETPNPENVLTGACNFYLDPTHRNPIPSPLLKFQCENHGLRSIEVLNMHPNTEAQIPGTTALSKRFNTLFYGAMDYAIVARSPAMKAVS